MTAGLYYFSKKEVPRPGREEKPRLGPSRARPPTMAVDLSKKASIPAAEEYEEAREEKCWAEEVFDALDEHIPPGAIWGFFIFAMIYILYHLTMFCLRLHGAW